MDLVLGAALLGRTPLAAVVRERPLEIALSPEVNRLVTSRLFFGDGLATPTSPALTAFRLLDEGRFLGTWPVVKVFEFVPGATLRVSGVPAGAPVRAATRVRTRLGRSLAFEVWAIPGDDGVASLRVPYATGRNGESSASEYDVQSGSRAAVVSVAEDDVVGGGEVAVRVR
jgi:hypothetical protein